MRRRSVSFALDQADWTVFAGYRIEGGQVLTDEDGLGSKEWVSSLIYPSNER